MRVLLLRCFPFATNRRHRVKQVPDTRDAFFSETATLLSLCSGSRYGGPPHDGPPQPATFRQFMAKLPDHITPDAAKAEYERYLARFYGDAVRAEFEQRKADVALRRQYDPRVVATVVDRRDEASRELAAAIAEQGVPLEMDDKPPGPGPVESARSIAPAPGSEAEEAPRKEEEHPRTVPVAWKDEVISTDLKLARQLKKTLDTERGILKPASSDQLGEGADANASAAPSAVPDKGGEGAPEADAETATEGATAAGMDVVQGTQEGDAELATSKEAEASKEDEAETKKAEASKEASKEDEAETVRDAALTYEERCEALDEALRYLWAVHGVDYYGVREFGDMEDPARASARRTVRPPKPEPVVTAANGDVHPEKETEATPANQEAKAKGEQEHAQEVEVEAKNNNQEEEEGGDAAREEKQPEPGDTSVKNDEPTNAPPQPARGGTSTGPVVAPDEEDRARRGYEGRVQRHWRARVEAGDPLVKLLHRQRVERLLEEFIDSQIIEKEENGKQVWANKLSAKKFVERQFVVKHIRNKHGLVLDAERERILDDMYYENFRAAREEERSRSHGGWGEGGRGGPRGGGGRGRGRGRGGPMPAMMMMNMGGPVFMPAGGPMGGMAPVIMAPMAPMMMPMGGRGGRGGRISGGRGGFGGPMMMAPAGGQYLDLDNPKNNRAVLDYGDL
jgi:hypothetical protein